MPPSHYMCSACGLSSIRSFFSFSLTSECISERRMRVRPLFSCYMLMLINSNDRTSLAALLTYGWKVIDEEDPKAPAYCNNIYQGGHLKSLHRKSSGIKMIVPLLFVTWFHILQGTKLVSSNILVGAEVSGNAAEAVARHITFWPSCCIALKPAL